MRTQARAVVIGGGVVGVSTLYHLAKKGWSDSVLLERKELTSGSTWHAAGLLPLFNLSYSVGQIHKYSVALYKRLGAETGLDVGFRQVSNIRLARTRDRLDEYEYYAGVAATIGGIEVQFLTPDQVKEIWPLWLHPARRSDAGAGARGARQRRRNQPADDRNGNRADA
jgi:dimethylglycine dehydrogenase